MAAGSRIVEVRTALVAALTTAINDTTGMESVHVGYGHPTGNTTPREIVWTQSGRLTFTPASLGAGPQKLNEHSGFDLMFKVQGPDADYEELGQRAIAISTVAVEWINANKNGETLAVEGLKWVLVNGEGSAEDFPTDSGHGSGIKIPITYSARLTQ